MFYCPKNRYLKSNGKTGNIKLVFSHRIRGRWSSSSTGRGAYLSGSTRSAPATLQVAVGLRQEAPREDHNAANRREQASVARIRARQEKQRPVYAARSRFPARPSLNWPRGLRQSPPETTSGWYRRELSSLSRMLGWAAGTWWLSTGASLWKSLTAYCSTAGLLWFYEFSISILWSFECFQLNARSEATTTPFVV